MAEEVKEVTKTTNPETQTPKGEGVINETDFVTLPSVDGKEVKIAKSKIDELDTEVSISGKIEKVKYGEAKKGYMRQNDYSRAMNETKKERDEINEIVKIYETGVAKGEYPDATGKVVSETQVEAGKDELPDLTPIEFSENDDPLIIVKKLTQRENDRIKREKFLLDRTKSVGSKIDDFITKQESNQKIQAKLFPVLKKYPQLDQTSGKFNQTTYELFEHFFLKHKDKDPMELADNAINMLSEFGQSEIQKYLDSKQEQKKETPVITPQSATTPVNAKQYTGKSMAEAFEQMEKENPTK
jgi:hypothetical protein